MTIADSPIVDRRAAREALLARYRDEHQQPDGTVAIRCTAHGRFISWCSPPAPPCTVACPPACGTTTDGPALHDTAGRPA